jgi:uncharacterized membrane protein
MNWLIFALISIVSISVANMYQRLAMRQDESDPIGASILFFFVLTVITGVFAVFKGFVIPPFSQYPFQFAFSCICYALGTIALFRAAKYLDASEMQILSGFGTLVAILGGVLLLGEHIGIKQGIGIILIFSAVFLVQKRHTVSKNKGALYAIVGACLYGLALISDTFVLRTYDAVSYVVVTSFVPGILLLIAYPKTIRRIHTYFTKSMKDVLIYGFFYSIQAISYYAALHYGANLSQMAPFFKAEVLLTVLLAAIFLKEKKHLPLYLLGAALVTVGAILIA